jgi:MFS family permease
VRDDGSGQRRWDRVAYYKPVLLIAASAFFCELGFSTVNISTLPVYLSKELHAVQWLGFILGFQNLFDTVSRPFLGALGDRFGRRWVVISGPILSAVTAAVTVYISIGVLFGFRIVDGLAAGALWTSVYAETGDITDEKHRNTAMSIVNVAFIIALAFGPLTGGLLDHYTGRYFSHVGQPAFLFSSLALLTGSAIAFGIFRPKKWEKTPTKRSRVSGPGFKPRDLLYTVRTFPRMLILAFLLYIGLGLIVPLIKLYAMDRYNISELAFGYVLASEAIGVGILAVPLSRIGSRWGPHKAVFWGLAWIAGAFWVLTYSGRIWLVFLSAGLIGLGIVLALPAWLAFITMISPPGRKGEVLGIIGFSQGLGMLIGAALAGILFTLKTFHMSGLDLSAVNLPFFLASSVLTLTAAMSYVWVFRWKKL